MMVDVAAIGAGKIYVMYIFERVTALDRLSG
jgi:hypothetical protein